MTRRLVDSGQLTAKSEKRNQRSNVAEQHGTPKVCGQVEDGESSCKIVQSSKFFP